MTIAELRELEARATAGPWEGDRRIIFCDDEPTGMGQLERLDDVQFVIAFRNHARALIACAEALELIESIYDTSDTVTVGDRAMQAYEMFGVAKAALAALRGE